MVAANAACAAGPASDVKPARADDLPVKGRIEWTEKRLPFVNSGGISGFSLVALKGKVYLCGGFIPGGDETREKHNHTSKWAHVYDPATDEWTRLPDMPARREYHRIIPGDNGIFVIGGASQGKPYKAHDEVFFLDLSGNKPEWKEVGKISAPRTHMAAERVGNMLVIAGGNQYGLGGKAYSPQTVRDVAEVFDLTAPDKGWQVRKPMPKALGWAASAACGQALYSIGGAAIGLPKAGGRFNDCYRYDVEKDEWSAIAPFPDYISAAEADAYQDRYVIMVGGVRYHGDAPESMIWSPDVFAYDTLNDTWFRMDAALPKTRWSSNPKVPEAAPFNDPGVCIIGDTIYVAGAEGPKGSHFNYFLIGKISMGGDGAISE